MSLPSATNARILEEIAKLSSAIHSIELQLAKRITAEALADTHLTVQLLKQQVTVIQDAAVRKEKRIAELEALVKRLSESASDNSTRWSLTSKIGAAVLSIIAGIIGAALGRLLK